MVKCHDWLVIDDFIDLEYQEKLKIILWVNLKLMEDNFTGITLMM